MDDGKGFSDHALNYEAVHNAENNCPGTIKVH